MNIHSILGIILFIIFIISIAIIIKLKNKKITKQKNKNNNQYHEKNLLTKNEMYFFEIIKKNFSDKYIIMPQVNLASIIEKNKNYPTQYQNELFRNVDFGIFDKKTTKPLLLIEINDSTHNQYKRKERDKKVKEICEKAQIKIINFYTNYPNKENYIVKRIKENLPTE